MGEVRALHWTGNRLRLLDQTRLPGEEVYLELEVWPQVVEAIRELRVRGAPALGVAGAYALALAGQEYVDLGSQEFQGQLGIAAEQIAGARPTAVNLAWAVRRALNAARKASSPGAALERLLAEAHDIETEDLAANRRIGALGAELIPRGATVLTHCNTGALATAGYGTALGVIRTAWAQGKVVDVIATETRPLLQGARLTAWELAQEGIPVTLVVEGAVGHVLRQGRVQAMVVGADRIAANGDVANKIGTYTLAVLGRAHGVPLYVAAPRSTVDLETPTGADIPIEERGAHEVACLAGTPIAPDGASVYNPAFDVTPAEYIGAIVTEAGVVRPPYEAGLREVVAAYE